MRKDNDEREEPMGFLPFSELFAAMLAKNIDKRIMSKCNSAIYSEAKNELAFMIYEVEHGRSE